MALRRGIDGVEQSVIAGEEAEGRDLLGFTMWVPDAGGGNQTQIPCEKNKRS